jgi:predicted dehydrogenase
VESIRKVKIYGAGSIGNHLANASRRLGWEVTVCDISDDALARMKTKIYPERYGAWDEAIQLFPNAKAPKGGFDLIIIGTPPEYHLPLAVEALGESPKALLIEKPICPPDLSKADDFQRLVKKGKTRVFVGYDHVVGKALKEVEHVIESGVIGQPLTLDVEFREHWEGIFKAHSWLKGPEDSYLGYWQKGGGASGEHSHALNLWQHLAHVLEKGRVIEVSATIHYVKEGKAHYDDLFLLNLKTEKGLVGRVVQDVVTRPSRKWARVQGTDGAVDWVANYNTDGDAVMVSKGSAAPEIKMFPKKRPDDFIEELKHIEAHLQPGAAMSPLSWERGIETMSVVAAAHASEEQGETIGVRS